MSGNFGDLSIYNTPCRGAQRLFECVTNKLLVSEAQSTGCLMMLADSVMAALILPFRMLSFNLRNRNIVAFRTLETVYLSYSRSSFVNGIAICDRVHHFRPAECAMQLDKFFNK